MLPVATPSHAVMRPIPRIVCAAVLAVQVPAQTTQPEGGGVPGVAALARVQVIEEQEGDLAAAEREYRALLARPAAEVAAAVRQEAQLRLGRLLLRLGRADDARGVLQQAAQGGGLLAAEARHLLQGQGPEGERQAQLRERARVILRSLDDRVSGIPAVHNDLMWLGEPAAVETVGYLRGLRASLTDHANLQRFRPAIWVMLGFLWHHGGPAAEEFFRSLPTDPNVEWRRACVDQCHQASDTMVPVAWALARDPDPEGKVNSAVLRLAHRVPLADFLPLLEDPSPVVRGAAFQRLVAPATEVTPLPALELVERIEPVLRRGLSDPDPRAARPVWQFLLRALSSPVAFRIVLEWLPRWPAGQEVPTLWGRRLDDADLQHVLRTAEALGPLAAGERHAIKVRLAELVTGHLPAWGEVGVAPMLRLLDLGYGRERSRKEAAFERLVQQAADADLVRLVGLLDRVAEAEQVVGFLCLRDLPEGCAAPLQRHLTALLQQPDQPQQPQQQQQLQMSVYQACQAIGRTRSPAAAAWLADLAARRPEWYGMAVHGAVWIGARAPLRELLILATEHGSAASARDQVFAELARQGDEAAIPLFPRAYRLGLDASSPQHPRVPDWLRNERRGVGWLLPMKVIDGTGQVRSVNRWDGYDPGQLAAAWPLLLAGPARNEVIADLVEHARDLTEDAALALAETLAEDLDALAAVFADSSLERLSRGRDNRATRQDTLNRALHLVARMTSAGDDPRAVRHRTAIARLLEQPRATWAVASELPRDVVPQFADQLRRLLRDPRLARPALAALRRAEVSLETADWLALLQGEDGYGVRLEAVRALREPVAPEVLRAVEDCLQTGDDDLRAAACATLGRLLAADSAGALLAALRDADGGVRAAATEALQRIRLYHEQKAFWDQFQQGIATGREAATAKLLSQARPGAPAEQRVLAIRSLGALGAPEALPYLIEWSQESDAAIAVACQAAITAIHQQAGIK